MSDNSFPYLLILGLFEFGDESFNGFLFIIVKEIPCFYCLNCFFSCHSS